MPLSARFVVYSSLVGWIVSTSNGMRSRNNASWSTQAFQLSRHRHHPPPRRAVGQPSLFRTKSNGDIFLPAEERPRGSWPSTVLVLRGGDSGVGWMTRRRKGPRSGRLEPAKALPHYKQHDDSAIGKNNRRLSSQPPRHAATAVIATTNDNNDADDDDVARRKSRREQNIVLIRTAVLGAVAVAVAAHYRHSWTPYFNKQAIQDGTLALLQKLRHGEDPAAAAATPVRAMLLYGLGMCVWEALGLSTIPVETAAGMVFRFHEAAVASITGKVLGATLAFLAGRTVLSSSLDKNKTIATSRLFVLLRSKNKHHPLLTAALMKFSILPELVKNLGCSVLPQIKLWMFLTATMLHGGGFSLMWTWLGTSMRLNETSRALRATLIVGAFIGGVLTPITMAWWIRALQAMSASGENKSQLDMIVTPTRITGIGGAVTFARQRIDAYLVRPTSLAEMWIGGLCLASIAAIVIAQKVVV